MQLFADTTPEAEAVLIDLLRQKTPAQRLRMMAQLNQRMRTLARAGLRQRHPDAGEAEIDRRLAGILLGAPIAERANLPASNAAGADLHRSSRREEPMGDELLQATAHVIDAFDSLNIPYLIGGSVASTVYGVARTTVDSDIVADIRSEHIVDFVRLLGDEFYLSVTAIAEAVALRGSFNLIHLETAFKVDVFVPKERPFDRAQFARATVQVLDEATGSAAAFATAEDVILAKLEWYRLGGEQSDRQWQDVLGIIAVQGDRLDWNYMRQMAATLTVSDLLERLAI